MTAPLPPIEAVDNVFERTAAAIEALQAHKPKTKAEERRRAAELVRLRQTQLGLAEQVISENAAQRIAEVIGNDHSDANAVQRLNGKGNGHAPATEQPNWALVIGEMAAQQELSCRRQIEAVKEELVALVAKSVGDVPPLTTADIPELAKGLNVFLKELLAETMAPRDVRLDEIESVVRSLVEWRARNG